MTFAEAYRAEAMAAIGKIDLALVERAIEWFREARENDRTIFIAGNGGSAATASHFVCDMVKGASAGKPSRFRIQALHDSLPTPSQTMNRGASAIFGISWNITMFG